jgi:GntR family transcriptional regulator/MocR family aminotransferase
MPLSGTASAARRAPAARRELSTGREPAAGRGPAGGPELLIELRRARGAGSLRAQLEAALRAAIADGRLAAGARLPPSRTLAADLGVSRRLVVEAYAQLTAEHWLEGRSGSGTYVAARVAEAAVAPPPAPRARPPRFDFFPGAPSLAAFPRTAWSRALREALREAPDAALGYGDPAGELALRSELAAYLRRTRGAAADPRRIVVVPGALGGLALLASVLVTEGRRRIAIEDPGLDAMRHVLARAGAEVVPVPVDSDGLDVDALAVARADAVLVTPGHQFPTGVGLSPIRRGELLAWARETGGLVIEDDYNAELRYDRPAVGALHGLAPDAVAYLGSVSKALAPALRIGWLALPQQLVGPLAAARMLAGAAPGPLEQLALARLLARGELDRQLRVARRRYRAQRAALAAALEQHIPGARMLGQPGGVHAPVRAPFSFDAARLGHEAAVRGVSAFPLSWFLVWSPPRTDTLVLGFGQVPAPSLPEAIRLLADALHAAR